MTAKRILFTGDREKLGKHAVAYLVVRISKYLMLNLTALGDHPQVE